MLRVGGQIAKNYNKKQNKTNIGQLAAAAAAATKTAEKCCSTLQILLAAATSGGQQHDWRLFI